MKFDRLSFMLVTMEDYEPRVGPIACQTCRQDSSDVVAYTISKTGFWRGV